MTRIEEWAKRVTEAIESAGKGLAFNDQKAAQRVLLEREVRAFVLESYGKSKEGMDVLLGWLDGEAHNFAECGREDCDLCANCGEAQGAGK